MKQLLTVLIAAMFAAVSLGAIAQDKGKSETQKEMKKKEGKKVAKEKKATAKKPVKVEKK
jgi:Ni/Co efflux regulator RcnB